MSRYAGLLYRHAPDLNRGRLLLFNVRGVRTGSGNGTEQALQSMKAHDGRGHDVSRIYSNGPAPSPENKNIYLAGHCVTLLQAC